MGRTPVPDQSAGRQLPRVPPRVVCTDEAAGAISRLVADRGPVFFFQSGGCCDGSLPMCFAQGELILGHGDVLLGSVAGAPFYIDARQYERWRHTQLVLGVRPGEPEGFSLGAGADAHFVTWSRVFSEDELAALDPVDEGPAHDEPVLHAGQDTAVASGAAGEEA